MSDCAGWPSNSHVKVRSAGKIISGNCFPYIIYSSPRHRQARLLTHRPKHTFIVHTSQSASGSFYFRFWQQTVILSLRSTQSTLIATSTYDTPQTGHCTGVLLRSVSFAQSNFFKMTRKISILLNIVNQ